MLDWLLKKVLDPILDRVLKELGKWKYWEPRWAKPLIPVLIILTSLGAYLSLWPSGDELNHTLFPWVVAPKPTPMPSPIVWFSELEPLPVSGAEFLVEVKAREKQPNTEMWLLYEGIKPEKPEYMDKVFAHPIYYIKKEWDVHYWRVNFSVLDPLGLGSRITLAAILVNEAQNEEYNNYMKTVEAWEDGGGELPAPFLDRKPGEAEVSARAEIDLKIVVSSP